MIKLFFSYCHQDESLRDELEVHLSALRKQGVIETWHDRRITAGSEFDGAISEHLASSDIILLLVSPYFINSDYCYDVEMRRALERHAAAEARVIPVILHPCDWHHAPFGKLLAVPTDGKPVSKFPNQHDAYLEVVAAVRKVAKELAGQAESRRPESRPQIAPVITKEARSSNLRVRKDFSDSEVDDFLDHCFEYIANFFEASLNELKTRNVNIDSRFRRIDANHFSAIVYTNGAAVSECKTWLGGFASRHKQILFSYDASTNDNSYNESLSVVDDGHSLLIKTSMGSFSPESKDLLSEHGAAEYLWAKLMTRLQ